ncbi:hybrid sensor histidine kinase/response regulator [Tautonia marina]|uniref:hybrid sensor histidine kinase/response regulator n=1 Tax=Tautonia marina TaxID=2653855 RepID=UPI0012609EB4|nr:hybrid sensor histidine kinase/response regulator [Tautonia marina]
MKIPTDEFVIQAREHLAALEHILLSLEGPVLGAASRERVDRCLRIVHSIKGDAGFLGFTAIRTLADAMETVLETLRDPGGHPPNPAAVERLLLARDRLAALVDDLESGREADLGGLLDELERVARQGVGGPEGWDLDLREVDRLQSGRLAGFFAAFERLGRVSSPAVVLDAEDLSGGLPSGPVRFRVALASETPREEIRRALGLPEVAGPEGRGAVVPLAVDLAEWSRSRGQSLATLLADLDRWGRVEGASLEFEQDDLGRGLTPGPVVLRGQFRTAMPEDDVARRLAFPIAAEPPEAVDPPPAPATGVEPPLAPAAGGAVAAAEPERASLRINVELLDRLMTLTSELTLIRNQSLLAFDLDDDRVRPIVQRLDAVTSALQETVLRSRMQPIGNLFGKFPRVVRDLARQLGKQVELRLVGRDVELDKTILEQLSDPLTHLVRNSVDHGIEPPDERVARGKPPVGRIVLSASHEEGRIRIEIRDDGRGLDPQSIRDKALAMRLKTEAELDRMADRELSMLILVPGFSTARAVSDVSGRGVGMDVVKTNIEHLEGTLAIDSRPGAGTAMILRLPLTLAIIPCLIVTVGGERYAVPQRDLEEAVCLHPRLAGRVVRAFDTEVYRLRGQLLPIVRLADVLRRRRPPGADADADAGAGGDRGEETGGTGQAIAYILVLRSASRRFGLVVDEVRGTEEVVVKPMHPAIKPIGIFSGATIMGDGRVALIVDVAGIVEHARPGFEPAAETAAEAARGPDASKAVQPHRVLLFEHGPHEQFALPLLQIRRVEMVDLDRVERVGEHEYVAVDGVSMRLLRLDRVMGVSAPPPLAAGAGRVPLILPKFVAQPMAILASRIVDTEALAVELQSHPEHDRGILGSAIVRGRMTLFVDIFRLSAQLFGTPPSPGPARGERPRRLLLLDDTPFFLEVVRRYLSEEGHEVETAVNGLDGLARLADGPPFDLIVSDIEMPVMDGWEFAREVRRRGVPTPLLALTSLSGAAYEARARECGFDDYEVKLDHDRLVRKVAALLGGREAGA